MKKKLLMFGTGKISECISYFFERDSEFEICAYAVDDVFKSSKQFNNKPVVKLSECAAQYPSSDYQVFVAVGYQGMNQLRRIKIDFFKENGYVFANYQSPSVKGNFSLGENSIVMDGALIQPCVKFGNNVFVWGGAMIGHHAVIEDNCWLTGGCLIGGSVRMGLNSFIGLGAVVGHEVNIGEKCMLGAGTIACKSIPAGTVLVAPNTEPHRLNSDQFIRMSSCFRT